MMAQSPTRSNQRPETLMQDRSPPTRPTLLRRTAEPYIGSKCDVAGRRTNVRLGAKTGPMLAEFPDRRGAGRYEGASGHSARHDGQRHKPKLQLYTHASTIPEPSSAGRLAGLIFLTEAAQLATKAGAQVHLHLQRPQMRWSGRAPGSCRQVSWREAANERGTPCL